MFLSLRKFTNYRDTTELAVRFIRSRALVSSFLTCPCPLFLNSNWRWILYSLPCCSPRSIVCPPPAFCHRCGDSQATHAAQRLLDRPRIQGRSSQCNFFSIRSPHFRSRPRSTLWRFGLKDLQLLPFGKRSQEPPHVMGHLWAHPSGTASILLGELAEYKPRGSAHCLEF
jgi:hypothetical protein